MCGAQRQEPGTVSEEHSILSGALPRVQAAPSPFSLPIRRMLGAGTSAQLSCGLRVSAHSVNVSVIQQQGWNPDLCFMSPQNQHYLKNYCNDMNV